MPTALAIAATILGLASIPLFLYSLVGLLRIVRTKRDLPTARDGLELPHEPHRSVRVCVVVPAHNEEAMIARLVASLRTQDHPAMRAVLALDRCTDGTVETARRAIGADPRFEIVEIDACPEGWAGKTHAAWCGVTRSDGARDAEVLVFADADTAFDPGCVRATLALLRTRGHDLLSLLSTLRTEKWFEFVAQPAAGIELMYHFPLAGGKRGRRPFANGQFLMFTREAYDAIGGHDTVKAALLEDTLFARLVHESGRDVQTLVADGMLRCDMYDTHAEFRRGWKRIYGESLVHRVKRLRRSALRVRTIGTVLPVCALLAVGTGLAGGLASSPGWASVSWAGAAIGLGALAMLWLMLRAAYAMGRIPLRAIPLSVAGSWIVASILDEAAREHLEGTPTTWGGLSYNRAAR